MREVFDFICFLLLLVIQSVIFALRRWWRSMIFCFISRGVDNAKNFSLRILMCKNVNDVTMRLVQAGLTVSEFCVSNRNAIYASPTVNERTTAFIKRKKIPYQPEMSLSMQRN